MPHSRENLTVGGDSHRMLETLLGNLPGLVYRCLNDEHWTAEFFSAGTLSITGYPAAEFNEHRRHYADLIHPSDRDSVWREVQTALARRERFSLSYRIVTANGTERWVLEQGCGVFTRDGVLQALEGFVTDITEPQKAELAVRESEQRYRSLFAANPHPMWVYDLETLRFLAINDAAVVHYGYSQTEFLRMTIVDIRPADDLPRLEKNVRAVTTGLDESGCWRHRRRDGSIIEVEITSHTIDFDGRRAELVLAYDVTERRRTEATMRLQASALRATANAIMITDRNGSIEWVNPAWTSLTGYSLEEAVGKTPRILKSGAQDANFYKTFWSTVLAGQCVQGDLINRRKDGTLYHEHETITPVTDDTGGVTHFIAIKQDITERQHVEQQIRKLAAFPRLNPNPVLEFSADGLPTYANPAAHAMALDIGVDDIARLLPPETASLVRACLTTGQPQLRVLTRHGVHTISWSFHPIAAEGVVHCYAGDITARLALEEQLRQSQKMDAIGQLAGGVAHDFNNLLTVIHGNAEIARLAETSPQEVREALDEIRRASERAASLTRQLLAFGRCQVMQPRTVDLNEAVTGITRMLQRLIGEDIRLQINLHSRPLLIRADPGMLDQILMNLAVNARDAMEAGGTLTLSTALITLGDDHLRQHPELHASPHACLRVSDTGCGIPAENIAHIFEPFFTTKEPGKGTGLGLATVFGIVKQHGGALRVDSAVGRGTAFEVLLPFNELQADAGAETAAIPPPGSTGETILVVEDEAAVRRLAVRILETQGYRVLEAADGPAALQFTNGDDTKIDLLLTDMIMPGGLTGHDLAERLRAKLPGLRTVFMSGYTGDRLRKDQRLQEGFNFLQKPFATAALARCIRARLDLEP